MVIAAVCRLARHKFLIKLILSSPREWFKSTVAALIPELRTHGF
jgi:hypothetical protein